MEAMSMLKYAYMRYTFKGCLEGGKVLSECIGDVCRALGVMNNKRYTLLFIDILGSQSKEDVEVRAKAFENAIGFDLQASADEILGNLK